MNTLAILTPGAPLVSASAMGRVLLTLEADRPASRDLDADVMEAMGWAVTRESSRRPGLSWTMRSPLSRERMQLPRLSRRCDCIVALVLPFGWDWGVSRRGGRGSAWCSNGLPPEEDAGAAWFEQPGLTAELAFLRAALHAARWLIVDHKRSAPSAAPMPLLAAPRPLNWCRCRCDWEGPDDALMHGGRCPDCGSHVLRSDGA